MTKKKTYSFNLPEELIQRLDARADSTAGNSRSFVLGQELESWFTALDVTVREVKEKLSKDEALLILDVMNGTWMERGRMTELWMSSALLTQVADGCDLDGLDEKWGVNKEALLQKLSAMSGLQRFALADWARGIWKLTGTPGENADVWERELKQFRG